MDEQVHDGQAQERVPPAVAVLCADMMLSVRIQDAIARADGRAVVIEDLSVAGEALIAIDRSLPVLILIDLGIDGDTDAVIRGCKLRPHTSHIPIYAFGSHLNAEALQAARASGADHAWARSRMMNELSEVIDSHVNPPVRYLDGWDDELSELAREGIHELNSGEYFEQHELLEEAWLAEKRPVREMYQGILQVGVAFFHMENNNWSGAVKLFRRGLPKLRNLPEVCQGVEIGMFYRQADSIHREISSMGAESLKSFDRSRYPQIHFTARSEEK